MNKDPLRQLSLLVQSASELQQRASRLREAFDSDPQTGDGSIHLTEWLRLASHVSAAIKTLAEDASIFRREQAAALRAEGVTIAELAGAFRVSRQRMSVLLNQPQPAGCPSRLGAQAGQEPVPQGLNTHPPGAAAFHHPAP